MINNNKKKPGHVSVCVGLSLNGTLNLPSPPEVMLLAGPVLTLNPPTSQYMEGLVPSLQLEIKRGGWGVTPHALCRPSSLLASFSDLLKYSLSGFLFVCGFFCFLVHLHPLLRSEPQDADAFSPRDSFIPAAIFTSIIPLSFLI